MRGFRDCSGKIGCTPSQVSQKFPDLQQGIGRRSFSPVGALIFYLLLDGVPKLRLELGEG